jgi:hypothetical protein
MTGASPRGGDDGGGVGVVRAAEPSPRRAPMGPGLGLRILGRIHLEEVG